MKNFTFCTTGITPTEQPFTFKVPQVHVMANSLEEALQMFIIAEGERIWAWWEDEVDNPR